MCVKTVITYGKIRLCRGPTGLIPGVGQRSSRFQTRIIRKGRFPDVPAILFEQRVFPVVPCFDFAVVLQFETDQPAICVMCFSLYEGYSGNRRRQDLHPSSSNMLSSVCVCALVAGHMISYGNQIALMGIVDSSDFALPIPGSQKYWQPTSC